MALAQAIIEYVHDNFGCKTLFSTHYHELTDMASTLFDVKNVHVSISESDGEVTFLHKVMDGAVDKSYGINVAKLANLPDKVISRANELLEIFESKEKSSKPKVTQYQLNLDSPEEKKELQLVLEKLSIQKENDIYTDIYINDKFTHSINFPNTSYNTENIINVDTFNKDYILITFANEVRM